MEIGWCENEWMNASKLNIERQNIEKWLGWIEKETHTHTPMENYYSKCKMHERTKSSVDETMCGCHHTLVSASKTKSNCWACPMANGQWKCIHTKHTHTHTTRNGRDTSMLSICTQSFVWHAVLHQMWWVNRTARTHTHEAQDTNAISAPDKWMDKNKFPFGSFYLSVAIKTLSISFINVCAQTPAFALAHLHGDQCVASTPEPKCENEIDLV